MMIAERQNREKSLPRRRKKDIMKELQRNDSNQEDDDGEEEEEEDECNEIDNKKEEMNEAMAETNEALTVNHIFELKFHEILFMKEKNLFI